MVEYYAISPQAALKELRTKETGLMPVEAHKRLEKYGTNELQTKGGPTAFGIFIRQFKDFLIILLLFATAFSLALHEYIDAGAMFAIVLLSAGLGFIQEFRAEKAIEALKSISAPTARVVRNGRHKEVAAKDLVPGDIIILEEGDIVPADSRLIEAHTFQVNEASLTGESVPPKKFTDTLKEGIGISDQLNMVFMGSKVTYGKGVAVIVRTGMQTELGKIATSLETTVEPRTPLQIKFEKMSKQIGYGVLVLIAVVFATGVMRGGSVNELLIFSLSLAVAAVPSSLPAIVTIGLSMGAKTLAKKNMIIKSLPATESLGSATVICSDKTGTLTKNEMTITHVYTNDMDVEVSGTGYDIQGVCSIDGKKCSASNMERLLHIGHLCNNASLEKEKGRWKILGDPTEASLLVLARKAGVTDSAIEKRYKIVEELPFDSDRKRMTVIVKEKKQKYAFVKGAPDLILKECKKIEINGKVRKITAADRRMIIKKNGAYAGDALRVLGLAYRPVGAKEEHLVETVEKDLIFVGLVGMIDPPKEGVKEAVANCNTAGIRVMIITGDHALTTQAIADKIGLLEKGDLVITGTELEKMSDRELAKKIEMIRIIARALPIQKLRVVTALKKKGHIVAMTGDGVNDAPAIKKADIGISMGITGTDVAKEVSTCILVDDNFTSIVNGIHEGRNIYDKILKSTRYLLSCNTGEIVAVFMAILLNFPLPLIPLQILLMNLLTDGLPALGLSTEAADEDIMQRPPRDPREKPLQKDMLMTIGIFGLVMGVGTLAIFNVYTDQGLDYARTVAFTTLVMYEMFAVLGSRSLSAFKHLNLFNNKWLLLSVVSSILLQMAVLYVPALQVVFQTVPLSLMDWGAILAVSSLGFLVMEVSKFFIHPVKKAI